MIVQSKETAKQTSLIDLLGGSAKGKNSKGDNTFAQLLSSLNSPVKGEKSFEVVVDSKVPKPAETVKSAKSVKTSDTPKVNLKALENLVSGEEKKALPKELIDASDAPKVNSEEKKALPKELIDALSNDQVHSLIHKAKEYLKNSIEQKSPEIKGESKMLPKTLIGLVELADKMGIDMSEITLSTLDDKETPLFKELPTALLTKSVIELEELTRMEMPEGIKGKEALVALMRDVEVPLGETKQEKEAEKVSTQPLLSLLKGLDTAKEKIPQEQDKVVYGGVKQQKESSVHSFGVLTKGLDTSPAVLVDAIKEIVSKEQPKSLPSEHPKIPLPVQAEALSALLRGINEGEKTEEKVAGKAVVDEAPKAIHASKADSLEVKSKEAVQSMRHFAIDLKEAAESYKPPFTRVTMKLNPEKLGEVEVTLVQRGNNVHVNIQSSNASSVAFLAHNATELKAQLAGQGITNATMNFMSGGESQQQNSQNQQQHQQPNRFQAYESLQELESAQQELSALEIILPHYA